MKKNLRLDNSVWIQGSHLERETMVKRFNIFMLAVVLFSAFQVANGQMNPNFHEGTFYPSTGRNESKLVVKPATNLYPNGSATLFDKCGKKIGDTVSLPEPGAGNTASIPVDPRKPDGKKYKFEPQAPGALSYSSYKVISPSGSVGNYNNDPSNRNDPANKKEKTDADAEESDEEEADEESSDEDESCEESDSGDY